MIFFFTRWATSLLRAQRISRVAPPSRRLAHRRLAYEGCSLRGQDARATAGEDAGATQFRSKRVGIPHFARNVKTLLAAGSLFLSIVLSGGLIHAQPQPIDTANSVITIHVGKSGLFSAFGHNHTVRAPIAEGAIEEHSPKPYVEFRVASRDLKVLDPDVKPEEREQIQRDMQGQRCSTLKNILKFASVRPPSSECRMTSGRFQES